MLSTVLPPISAWTPQELLPIMPPSVQRLCVAGSGRERQVVHFGRVAQADRARYRAARAPPSTPRRADDAVHVLREVHDDRNVAALAGEAGACAARQDRRADLAARRESPPRRRLRPAESPARSEPAGSSRSRSHTAQRAGVEAHLAANRLLQPLVRAHQPRRTCRAHARVNWAGDWKAGDSRTPAGFCSGLLPDRFNRVESRLSDIGDGVGGRTGVPFELAGLDFHAMRLAARPFYRNDVRHGPR